VKQVFGLAKKAKIFLECSYNDLGVETSNSTNETLQPTVVEFSRGIIKQYGWMQIVFVFEKLELAQTKGHSSQFLLPAGQDLSSGSPLYPDADIGSMGSAGRRSTITVATRVSGQGIA
jgi:hypothetical protein